MSSAIQSLIFNLWLLNVLWFDWEWIHNLSFRNLLLGKIQVLRNLYLELVLGNELAWIWIFSIQITSLQRVGVWRYLFCWFFLNHFQRLIDMLLSQIIRYKYFGWLVFCCYKLYSCSLNFCILYFNLGLILMTQMLLVNRLFRSSFNFWFNR